MITPVDVALSQIGVREATGKNDGVPSERYQADPYAPGVFRAVPWCALFVLWCYRVSDWGPLDRTRRQWYRWANSLNLARALEPFRVDPLTAQPGDVVVWAHRLESDSPTGLGSGHTGLITSGRLPSDTWETVEGNLSNRVVLKSRALDDTFGVFRPHERP